MGTNARIPCGAFINSFNRKEVTQYKYFFNTQKHKKKHTVVASTTGDYIAKQQFLPGNLELCGKFKLKHEQRVR